MVWIWAGLLYQQLSGTIGRIKGDWVQDNWWRAYWQRIEPHKTSLYRENKIHRSCELFFTWNCIFVLQMMVNLCTSWSQLIDQSFIWRYESCYAIIGAENSHQLIDEIPGKQGLEKSFQNSQVLRVIIQQEQELWEERMLLAGALFPEESRQMYHMGRGVPRWEGEVPPHHWSLQWHVLHWGKTARGCTREPSHTNNNLSPDFPVSDHDHPDNRVQHQRDSSSEPTEVIVNDPQSQLVESWMKFRNGNWSAMSPWHGLPLGTIKFRCHPHPPPSPTTAMHLLIHPGTSASQAKCISLRFSGRNFTTRN